MTAIVRLLVGHSVEVSYDRHGALWALSVWTMDGTVGLQHDRIDSYADALRWLGY